MRSGIELVLAGFTALLACSGKTDSHEPSSAGRSDVPNGSGGSVGGSVSTPPIGYCFGKGTRIATPSGSVAIEDLRVGDQVQALDRVSHRVVTELVIEVFVHERRPVGLLRTALGELHVTPNHPIYDAVRRTFVPAGSLEESFESFELASNWSIAPTTLQGFQPLPEPEAVYNLTVANVHTYFAEGLLVHNKSRCGYPGDPPDCPCWADECGPAPIAIGGVGGIGGAAGFSAGGVNAAGSSDVGEAGAGGADTAASGAPSD